MTLLALSLLTVLGVLAMHGAALPAASPHNVHAMAPSMSMSSSAPGPAATSVDHPHGARHHVLSPCVADAARGSFVVAATPPELSTKAADRARMPVPVRRLETRALPPPDLQQLCISRT